MCVGPLHVANYPRKVRGIACGEEAFAFRFGLCCGRCRRRTTPPSVRFLGRRVYASLIVVLATMRALVCEALPVTLRRWRSWWSAAFPQTTLWVALQGRSPQAMQPQRLPGSLLEQCEASAGERSSLGLTRMLRLLSPLTSSSCMLDEGSGGASTVTQKMSDCRKDAIGYSFTRRRASRPGRAPER